MVLYGHEKTTANQTEKEKIKMKKMLSSLMATLLLLASLTGCAGSPKSENTQA